MPAPTALTCTVKDCRNARADQNPEATNRHCHEHRREAQRKYVEVTMEKQEGKGFVKGAQSMRECVAKEFFDQGGGMFSGSEIAQLVMQMPGPLPS